MEQRWTGITQVFFGLGITLLFFYMMAPFAVAILMGAVVAILCYPLYQKLRRRLARAIAALVVTFVVTVGILVPLGFVLVNGAYQLLGLLGRVRFTPEGQIGTTTYRPLINQILTTLGRFVPINRQWFVAQLVGVLSTLVEKTTQTLGAFLAGLPSLLLALLVVIISAYFLILDGSRFLRFLSSLAPMRVDRSRELYTTFEKSCRGVVLGLLASSLVQGILIVIFFLVTGLPNAVLMGIVGVVMGMVPIVGTAPITLGAIVYLFFNDEPGNGIVMIAGAVLIGTCDNIIRTWVLKGQSEMHPLLALVSAFGAVNLFGPTGIFLGPIIAAVFVSFLKILSLELWRESHPDDTTERVGAAPKAPATQLPEGGDPR